ncbi:MAG: N-acetylmuramoyl-L-alanine amidase [Chthoniobacterales bacterium]
MSRTRTILAWIGLALFVVSFVWFDQLPRAPWVPSVSDQNTPHGDSGFVVVIDAGHGGQDSGMIRAGILEKDLALDVARRLDRVLQSKGVPTLMTRSGDNYVSLAGRAAAANREQSAMFVSIHFDEARPQAAGIETYFGVRQISATPTLVSWLPFLQHAAADQASAESQNLAAVVQQALVGRTHAIDRGTRAERFYVISNVRHPAVLVEGGFLTNQDEATKLTTEAYREELATGIAEGLIKYREITRERERAASTALPGT